MATVTRRLAALLGASGAGLTDSATASKITTDSINDDAVNAAKIAANAVGTSEVADNVLTATDLAANSVGSSELDADTRAGKVITTEVQPHIIPGVLHPSYVALGSTSNKLLDGTTDHSGAFGTVQSDGRKYYYTNIKGSKPIKDPRIGTHFGSQRHVFKTIQRLENETAANNKRVFSVDGREWLRIVDVTGDGIAQGYNSHGSGINVATDKEGWIEIVGFFNAVNVIMRSYANRKSLTPYINGTVGSAQTPQEATNNGPLIADRYVDNGSVVPLTLPTTSLGINTLLIKDNIVSSHYTNYHLGVELIAHDTASDVRRKEIKIPKQNVVSFGKKFEVGSDDLDNAVHPHYDPFTTMSYGGSGTTLSNLQSLIDTDTSLGMDAWKAGTSNYHRPWNGGRVVKWVDSSGTIKTSVNMMPPNAQNMGTVAHNAVSDAHIIAGTNDDHINFNTSAFDHSQAEVAKTFHIREFGNGNANVGGQTPTYKDASMLVAGNHDIAYVMDDGLTSLAANDVQTNGNTSISRFKTRISIEGSNDATAYITFIGTGCDLSDIRALTFSGTDDYRVRIDGVELKQFDSGDAINEKEQIVQNLPYGTHVLMIDRVTANSNGFHLGEVTFYQPKRPPIPEDCVVLADYMLMADFVAQGAGESKISKGVRAIAASRDIYYQGDSSYTLTLEARVPFGYKITSANGGSNGQTIQLPFFGTDFLYNHYDNRNGTLSNGLGTDGTSTTISTSGFAGLTKHTGLTLGLNQAQNHQADGQNADEIWMSHLHVATPTHTSSHYQYFESPQLKELVGGDRNMEQTNLICSPDGKTWDELTRDTSYFNGRSKINIATSAGDTGSSEEAVPLSFTRGFHNGKTMMMQKDFALAYDKLVCLKNGVYRVMFSHGADSGGTTIYGALYINDVVQIYRANGGGSQRPTYTIEHFVNLERGDRLEVRGIEFEGSHGNYWCWMHIDEV